MDPLTGMAFALSAGSFLFDVFDKSVQAYGLYSNAQSLANVSGHLVAKLMIEERRLIQWGDGVGIKPVAQAAQTNDGELDDRLKKNEITDVDHLLPVNVWISETSISYDGEASRLGTISRQGCTPARLFVERKHRCLIQITVEMDMHAKRPLNESRNWLCC